MSVKFTYIKKYIIMKKDYTNIPNLNPKGHCKLEIRGNKGALNLNLENCELEKDYKVYLLRDEKGKIYELDIGRIITDEKGRSRTNITLNLRDLESKGFPIEKLDAILIRKGIYILLGGYIDNDTKIINRFIKELMSGIETEEVEESIIKEELAEETKEAIESIEEHEIPVISNIETEEVEEPIIKEESHEEELAEETKEIIEPIEDNETPVISDIETEEVEEPTIKEESHEEELVEETKEIIEPIEDNEIPAEELQDYQSMEYIRRLNHKNQMTNYILSILRFFPYVQPFRINLHGYSWWRIEANNIDAYKGFLPYYNYLMSADYKYPFLNNPVTCSNLITKYGHYLFGIYKEGDEAKYYLYGVPGKFTIEEYPYKGITGFNTWYESTSEIGYWILYIDPMTGKIIYPLNPMIPAY